MHVCVDERCVGRRVRGSSRQAPLPSSGLIVYSVPLVVVSRRAWSPPTDVYETADEVVVQLEIAGVSEDDLEIAVFERSLVIAGQRVDPRIQDKTAYHRMEIQYGDFETEVYLPAALAQDEVNATYHDGFLTIRFPKAQAHQVTVLADD